MLSSFSIKGSKDQRIKGSKDQRIKGSKNQRIKGSKWGRMNLKAMTDKELHQNGLHLPTKEREALTAMLHHLREVERRHLYSSLSYSSLHRYAVAEYGYSDDQA